MISFPAFITRKLNSVLIPRQIENFNGLTAMGNCRSFLSTRVELHERKETKKCLQGRDVQPVCCQNRITSQGTSEEAVYYLMPCPNFIWNDYYLLKLDGQKGLYFELSNLGKQKNLV